MLLRFTAGVRHSTRLFGHEKVMVESYMLDCGGWYFEVPVTPKVTHYNYEMKGILLLSLALPFRLSCREFKENQSAH